MIRKAARVIGFILGEYLVWSWIVGATGAILTLPIVYILYTFLW